MNPEQNNGAEQGNSGQEDIQAAAERRRGLERQWTERYVTRTDVVPAEQTDALIEEGIAAGMFIRQDGTPDRNFVGDNVLPAPGKETEAGAILAGMRSNRERYFAQPAVQTELNRDFYARMRVPQGMDAEQYVYDVARRAQQAGVWKEEPKGPRDGLLPGGRRRSTYAGGDALRRNFESRATRLIRRAEDDRITVGLGTDPALAGQNLARQVERAIREGKIELLPKFAKGKTAKKGDVPDSYTLGLAGGDEYTRMSQIYLDAFNDAMAANVTGKPPQPDQFKDYLDTIVKNLDRMTEDGQIHRDEIRQGIDTSATDAARARIEALNAEDQKFAPELRPAEVARLNRQRRAVERREGLTQRVRGRRGPRGEVLYEPTMRAYEAAYAEDEVARAGGFAHNEFQPRIDALQAQIDATTDRNLRAGFQEAMTKLLEERGQAGGDAQTRQAQRIAENAEVLARDPNAQLRLQRFEGWLANVAVVRRFEATGNWEDDGSGAWNDMMAIQQEAAIPFLNQAAMEMRRGTNPEAEAEALRQAFVATERVLAEYNVKLERVRESNDEAEQQILEATRGGEAISVNLGRSATSPNLNQAIVNDALGRFNMPDRPMAIEDGTGENGTAVRDLVYTSPNRPNVALVVRYDRGGRMISADLMTQPEGTTTRTRGRVRRGRVTEGLSDGLRNRITAADRTATAAGARVNFDSAATGGGGGGGGAERVDADWTAYRGPEILNNAQTRRRTLQRAGMTAETADLVTREPARRGGWRRFLGIGP